MSSSSRSGTVFIATGATVGAGVATTVGGMGLAGSFGEIGVGAAPVVGAGAIFGAAAYGATQALIDRDPVAGSFSLGTLAGAGIAGTIGKMGLVAPKIGLAVGVGTLPISLMGGICGLAAYGVAKMLDSGIPETPSQAIDRQEARIDWQADYVQALTDLTLGDLKWVDLELELRAATVEDELQALKQKIPGLPNLNIDTKTVKSTSNPSPNIHRTTPVINAEPLKENLHSNFNANLSEEIQERASSQWQLISTLKGHTAVVNSLAFSPDGKKLVSGSADRTIRLWQINRLESSQILSGHTGWVNTIAISPNGCILVSGSTDRTIKIWDLNTGESIATYRHHQAGIRSLAIGADNRTIASLDFNGLLLIWDLDTGEIKATLTGSGCVIFSPNSKTLATGGKGGKIQIWQQVCAEDSIATHTPLSGEWWEILGVNPDDAASQIKLDNPTV